MENTLKFCKANAKQIDETNGIIPFTLTTFAVDRDGDVIFPTGGILNNFKNNPVSLFMHNAFDVPPAKLLPDTIKSNAKEMVGDVQFDIVNDPFAKFLFDKYIDGYLSAGSIRFIPIEFDKEIAIEGQTGFGIKVWELIEFSLVTIPANPDALRKEYNTSRDGLYEDHEKRYYSAVKTFYEYHNRNLDIDKQIFSFCTGEGCKDLADTKEKENEILAIDPKEDEKSTFIEKDCECKETENTIKGEQNFLKEMTQSLNSIEDILKKLNIQKPEKKETKEETVSEKQFLEMLESRLDSKDKKGV